MTLKAPLEPDLIVTVVPKFSFIDLFVQVGSVLAFWYGVCIFHGLELLSEAPFKRIFRRKRVMNNVIVNNHMNLLNQNFSFRY